MRRWLFGLLVLFLTFGLSTASCVKPASQEILPETQKEASASEKTVDASSESLAETPVDATSEALLETSPEPPRPDATPEAELPPPDATPEAKPEALAEARPEAIPEGLPETSVPLQGFGQIRGPCGVLDQTEWKATTPFLFSNTIDFGTQPLDINLLSPGGKKINADGNLGGNSVNSEIFAYEMLYRCELAILLKTEKEITYKDPAGKKTDLLVSIDGYKVGVSVTRAYHFPPENPYTVPEAHTLLNKKLADILVSASNASTQDAWSRSMLYVLAYDTQYATTLETAYNQLDAAIRDKTILMITVTDGTDTFIYR